MTIFVDARACSTQVARLRSCKRRLQNFLRRVLDEPELLSPRTVLWSQEDSRVEGSPTKWSPSNILQQGEQDKAQDEKHKGGEICCFGMSGSPSPPEPKDAVEQQNSATCCLRSYDMDSKNDAPVEAGKIARLPANIRHKRQTCIERTSADFPPDTVEVTDAPRAPHSPTASRRQSCATVSRQVWPFLPTSPRGPATPSDFSIDTMLHPPYASVSFGPPWRRFARSPPVVPTPPPQSRSGERWAQELISAIHGVDVDLTIPGGKNSERRQFSRVRSRTPRAPSTTRRLLRSGLARSIQEDRHAGDS